jgi:hypothetical protein
VSLYVVFVQFNRFRASLFPVDLPSLLSLLFCCPRLCPRRVLASPFASADRTLVSSSLSVPRAAMKEALTSRVSTTLFFLTIATQGFLLPPVNLLLLSVHRHRAPASVHCFLAPLRQLPLASLPLFSLASPSVSAVPLRLPCLSLSRSCRHRLDARRTAESSSSTATLATLRSTR